MAEPLGTYSLPAPVPGRRSLRLVPAALGLVAIHFTACAPVDDSPPSRRHDVILISIDTLRADHTGLHGYDRETTPFLDELAAESLILGRAYTTDSWTLTAHMSMLTGLYPKQHGVVTKRDVLSPTVPTLAERLRDAGYHTIGLYFSGWIHPYFGFDRGFAHFEKHRNAEEAAQHLVQALADRPEDKPLFLFLHLFDVHNTPRMRERPLYDTPRPYADRFLPGALDEVADLDNVEIWERSNEAVTPEQHEALVALYDGGIRYADAKLEEWIRGWKESGLLDSALLVVVSDHGEGLAQRLSRYGGHGDFNEEGLRVPLLLRYPDGRRGGERVEQPVSIIDLLPTILESAGLEPDETLPGLPLDHDLPSDRLLFAQKEVGEALIQWPRKLIRGRMGNMVLYDLQQDPGEVDGLVGDAGVTGGPFSELLERARREQAAWYYPAAASDDELDPEHQKQLDSMGYGGGDDGD